MDAVKIPGRIVTVVGNATRGVNQASPGEVSQKFRQPAGHYS